MNRFRKHRHLCLECYNCRYKSGFFGRAHFICRKKFLFRRVNSSKTACKKFVNYAAIINRRNRRNNKAYDVRFNGRQR